MVFKGAIFPVYARRPFFGEEYAINYAENHDTRGGAILNSPFNLFKRAWTFQERLVSPILLLFTENQTLFERYEGRWPQETDSITRKTLKGKYRRLLTSSGVDSSEASWTDLMRSFTVLQLSYSIKKLPAFAAVAQQYLRVRPHNHTQRKMGIFADCGGVTFIVICCGSPSMNIYMGIMISRSSLSALGRLTWRRLGPGHRCPGR